jgi:hypothetical protein
MTKNFGNYFNIYVGTEIEQMLPTKVLEYSILKYSTIPVRVLPLFEAIQNAGIKIPVVTDPKNGGKTPFSFQRFAIPELNKYQGRALYVDSDMAVFRDIKELRDLSFDGADLLSVKEIPGSHRRSQFSVMLLNCEKLKWKAEDLVEKVITGQMTYENLVYHMKAAEDIRQTISHEWNSLERYESGETALTHFTDMLEQPWLNTVNPLTELWCQLLLEAVENKFVSKNFVEDQVSKNWVRPSLLYQIEQNIADPNKIPKSIRMLDHAKFIAPPLFPNRLKSHGEYGKSNPSMYGRAVRYGYASARYVCRDSIFARAAKKAIRAI